MLRFRPQYKPSPLKVSKQARNKANQIHQQSSMCRKTFGGISANFDLAFVSFDSDPAKS